MGRHHVDRSTEIRRADRGCRSRTPIEHCLTDELTRKESPRVVSWRVCIVERNTIEGHGVVAILKAAKKGLTVSETRAVGSKTECAWSHLDDFGVVGDRRCEISNIVRADHRLRRARVQRALRRSQRSGQRKEFSNDDFLTNPGNCQRDGDVLQSVGSKLQTCAARRCKPRRRYFYRVAADRKSINEKPAFVTRCCRMDCTGHVILYADAGVWHSHSSWIQNRSGNCC